MLRYSKIKLKFVFHLILFDSWVFFWFVNGIQYDYMITKHDFNLTVISQFMAFQCMQLNNNIIYLRVHAECAPPGQSCYLEDLKRLRNSVRQKRPYLWGTKDRFSHPNNASVHAEIVMHNLLAKNDMTSLPMLPTHPILLRVTSFCSQE